MDAPARPSASPRAASARAWWAAVPRCCALNRLGLPCCQPVRRVGDVCKWHGSGVRRGRPTNEIGERIAIAGAHGRLMKAAWRRDPWALGATIYFTRGSGGEERFQQWLAASGIHTWALAPSVADWARWRVRAIFLQGGDVLGPDGHRLHDAVRERMDKAGPPPAQEPPDFTDQSERDAWRKGIAAKKAKPWVKPVLTMGERLHAAAQARARMGLPPLRHPGEAAGAPAPQAWAPGIGPAQLTPGEQALLAAAQDAPERLWRAQADIEAARRLFY